MTYPSKLINIGGHDLQIFGISENDPYYLTVGNDMEADYIRVAEMNVPVDAVCLDIGANIGVKALQLAHLAREGRVVAVEAGPKVFSVLQATVAASGLKNLLIEHMAVADHDGAVTFAEDSAFGHIAAGGVAVRATTIASLMKQHGLSRLDFVKIDVEGFELPILRSSIPVFAQYNTVICFEFNSWCQMAYADVNPRQFLAWVLDTFAEVYALRRGRPPETALERIHPAGVLTMLHNNFFQDGHVTDLVVCMTPGGIKF